MKSVPVQPPLSAEFLSNRGVIANSAHADQFSQLLAGMKTMSANDVQGLSVKRTPGLRDEFGAELFGLRALAGAGTAEEDEVEAGAGEMGGQLGKLLGGDDRGGLLAGGEPGGALRNGGHEFREAEPNGLGRAAAVDDGAVGHDLRRAAARPRGRPDRLRDPRRRERLGILPRRRALVHPGHPPAPDLHPSPSEPQPTVCCRG